MVSRLYTSANPSSGRFRKCIIYAAVRGDRGGGRGGNFNFRGRGRGRGRIGGQGRGGKFQGVFGEGSAKDENGIDISDVTSYFEDSEWGALSNDTKQRIAEDPVRINFLANKKRRATRSISAGKYNKNWLIAQIITGVQKRSQNESRLS